MSKKCADLHGLIEFKCICANVRELIDIEFENARILNDFCIVKKFRPENRLQAMVSCPYRMITSTKYDT